MPASSKARLTVATALCAVGTAAAVAAQAGTGGLAPLGAGSISAPVPLVTSSNVTLLTTVPETDAISLEFARTGPFAYVSSLDTITVLDTTDPKAPEVRGSLVNVLFENEAMTYGERREPDGTLTRFVLAGIDLYQVSPDDPSHVNVGGDEVAIVDVTDPDKPFIRSYVNASTGTHTVQCVSQAQCDHVYTSGGRGEFSILDLTDLDAPKELKGKVPSLAAGPNPVFTRGSGHYWDFEQDVPVGGRGASRASSTRDLGWHTGSGGVQVFDVTDPTNPVPIGATNAQGREAGTNDFILHNSMRPNADRFRPGAEPSVANGNVLLVTEEDYLNDGDEVVCENAGSFQTWHVPALDGGEYSAASKGGTVVDKGSIELLDSTNAPHEFGGGVTPPAGGFCSAHWFDVHQDGFVAQGYYQQGLRILDVRDAEEITQIGYSTSVATQTWDAYWYPVRDEEGVVTGEKTSIVYTADAVRGVDVYEVDLPTSSAEGRGPKG